MSSHHRATVWESTNSIRPFRSGSLFGFQYAAKIELADALSKFDKRI